MTSPQHVRGAGAQAPCECRSRGVAGLPNHAVTPARPTEAARISPNTPHQTHRSKRPP